MSFGIGAKGTAAGVKKALEESKGYGDAIHHDLVRDAALAVINDLPEHHLNTVFVEVEASGHHDYTSPAHPYGNIDLKIKIGPFLK